MSLEQNKTLVRQFVEVVQNQHNLAALDEFFSPGLCGSRRHDGSAEPCGRQSVLGRVHVRVPGFPIIHQQLAEDDRVMTYKTCQATHLGSFHGVPAAG